MTFGQPSQQSPPVSLLPAATTNSSSCPVERTQAASSVTRRSVMSTLCSAQGPSAVCPGTIDNSKRKRPRGWRKSRRSTVCNSHGDESRRCDASSQRVRDPFPPP
jgi:hypothetical protein